MSMVQSHGKLLAGGEGGYIRPMVQSHGKLLAGGKGKGEGLYRVHGAIAW